MRIGIVGLALTNGRFLGYQWKTGYRVTNAKIVLKQDGGPATASGIANSVGIMNLTPCTMYARHAMNVRSVAGGDTTHGFVSSAGSVGRCRGRKRYTTQLMTGVLPAIRRRAVPVCRPSRAKPVRWT